MALIGSIVGNITANTAGFVTGINKTKASLLGLSATAKTTSISIGGLVASLAPILGVTGVVGAIRATEDFNKALKRSTSIIDVTEEQYASFAEKAREIGRSTKFSATEAAESFFFLLNAGFNVEQSLKAADVAAKFAQASFLDLATATDRLTDIQNTFELKSDDATQNLKNLTKVADLLVKSQSLTTVTTEQLSDALLNKAGLSSQILGQNIEETTAALLAFASRGNKGRRAGEQLAIVNRRLGELFVDNGRILKELDINVFDEQTKEFRGLLNISRDLNNAFGDLKGQEIAELFDRLNIPAKAQEGFKLLIKGADDIEKFQKTIQEAPGTIESVAGKLLTDFEEAINQVEDTFLILSEQIVKPLLENIATPLKDGAKAIADFVEEGSIKMQIFNLRVIGIFEGLGEAIVRTFKLAFDTLIKLLPLVRSTIGRFILTLAEESVARLNPFDFSTSEQRLEKFAERLGRVQRDAVETGREIFDELGAGGADLFNILKPSPALQDQIDLLEKRLQPPPAPPEPPPVVEPPPVPVKLDTSPFESDIGRRLGLFRDNLPFGSQFLFRFQRDFGKFVEAAARDLDRIGLFRQEVARRLPDPRGILKGTEEALSSVAEFERTGGIKLADPQEELLEVSKLSLEALREIAVGVREDENFKVISF